MNPSPILYVEDEESDVFLMQHVFAKAGIKNPLHSAADGQAALDYLAPAPPIDPETRRPGAPETLPASPRPPLSASSVPPQAPPLIPALILLDLNLPILSGMEVLAWIRQQPHLRHLPVLIFSSSSRPEDIAQAYQAGASGYLVKPGSLDELTALVLSLRDFWLVHNHPAALLAAQALPASTSWPSRPC